MKKVFLMSLALCLLLFSTLCAQAETFSECSDEALLEQLDALQAEIAARHIEKTASLAAGTYVGGRDIPAGDYILASAGTEGDAGIVSLRSVNDAENDWPSKLYEFRRAQDGYSVYVTIEEGDTLIVPYPYKLTISAGVMFE